MGLSAPRFEFEPNASKRIEGAPLEPVTVFDGPSISASEDLILRPGDEPPPTMLTIILN